MTKYFLLGAGLALCGCQSINANSITPAQVGAVTCILASDGATVVGIVRPGVSIPANAAAAVLCDASTRVGQAVTVAK